ncbi:hypothetical protein VSS37_03405 [Candidatus Thiothrix sp. Deng01]|uniref:Uncharacterized protein n=1 Tax=Candidatus Thiothrix phosphatis TaxID=3112415 RepID=A0ABU6CVB8_9GAMM|nr:hypothetical protein [Candidatus Thiothrix sp. Deng01]MEB4590017.1 hypothetical protein [Candidatus Thiothrix sp. Deng01]
MFTSNQKFVATFASSMFCFAVMASADKAFAACSTESISNLSIESALSTITHHPVSEINVCKVGNIHQAQNGYVSARVTYVIDKSSMYENPCDTMPNQAATVTVKGSC